jgi:peptide/nickel transport system substrate-binding protein
MRVLALALAALLAGAPAAASPPAPPAVTLRYAWWADAGFPTPFAFSTLGPAGVVRLTLVYDTLVWKDDRGLIPWLADSWRVSPDGTAYVFTLHAPVRWQDGEPLTARDVRFSFEYYRRHPFAWVDTSVIRSVEVRDARTLVVRLTHPFAPFLENVAGIVPIIPEHLWRGVAHPEREQDLRMAVGSGPYRLAAYHPEAGEYRFLAFDGYFKGAPRLREIQFLLVPPERQLLAVRNGQVDVAMTIAADAARAFAGDAALRVYKTDPLSIARLVFNLRRPPTSERWFRQAVAYGLDRKRLAEIMTRGRAIVGSAGVIPPTDPWYSDRVRRYPYDPRRARTLVREFGSHEAGGRLSVGLVTGSAPEGELIRQMLKDVGIDVTIQMVDPATGTQLATEGRFQMLFTTHVGSGGDPDYLRTWFTGEDANLFARGTAMRSGEYLRLARLETLTLDPRRRKEDIAEMQMLLSEDLPTLPLYYRRFYWIYDSRKMTPIRTYGGLLNGIPLVENKLIFLRP